MATVKIYPNPEDRSIIEVIETQTPLKAISESIPQWSQANRIYHGEPCIANDITPECPEDLAFLDTLDDLTVMVNPAAAIAIPIVVSLVTAVAISYLLYEEPEVPVPVDVKRQSNQESPNNALGDRTNQVRIKGRIPDIYGTVRSYPDLISVPYKVFIGDVEYEYSALCIGKGYYNISDVKEAANAVTDISTVSIYKPNESRAAGDSPQATFPATAPAVDENIKTVVKSSAVTGQTALPPNSGGLTNIEVNILARDVSGTLQLILYATDTNINFEQFYAVGDVVGLQNCEITFTPNLASPSQGPWDLDGNLEIAWISGNEMRFVQPWVVQPNWGIPNNNNQGTGRAWYEEVAYSPQLQTHLWTSQPKSGVNINGGTSNKVLGPFRVDIPPDDGSASTSEEILVNMVAVNGLYKLENNLQEALTINFEIVRRAYDENDQILSTATSTFSMTGSNSSKGTVGKTVRYAANTAFAAYYTVSIERLTNTDYGVNGTVSDEVKWRDLYMLKEGPKLTYGNVTTVQVLSQAVDRALSPKERKINMLVQRKLPVRANDWSTAEGDLQGTNFANEIFTAICLDPDVGNQAPDYESLPAGPTRDAYINEYIDIDNIYDTITEVVTHFGANAAAEFSYTFANDNISFEEMIQQVSSAVFCQAFRQGQQFRINFEREIFTTATMLFSGRNKLPNSEQHSFRFGLNNDNDGIEYEYVSPDDDALVSIRIPSDGSAINPKVVESIGVRDPLQAYFHAQRIYRKQVLQNESIEFEATQEALSLVRGEVVLVTQDDRRGQVIEGEITGVRGIDFVTLSEPYDHSVLGDNFLGWTTASGILSGGVIIAQGNSLYEVQVSAPNNTVINDPDNYARSQFFVNGPFFGQNINNRATYYIVKEVEADGPFKAKVSGVFYDPKYYTADSDYRNGDVDIDGNPI